MVQNYRIWLEIIHFDMFVQYWEFLVINKNSPLVREESFLEFRSNFGRIIDG
jgi:hypothetical protein